MRYNGKPGSLGGKVESACEEFEDSEGGILQGLMLENSGSDSAALSRIKGR